MLINSSLSLLDGKRLSKLFRESYEHDAINYTDPIIKPRKLVAAKSYKLGFLVTRQMVEDDLYGDIFNMKLKKMKLKVKTLHSVDGNFGRLTLEDGMFRVSGLVGAMSEADFKQLIRAFNLLQKVNKPVKKVIKRRKRVKA